MQATDFATLRDLILFYAAQRGWSTQRHVAVICGLDESALSRFLSGEQDIGARRTHALFQSIGVPVEQYDLAYALLGRAQDGARELRHGRREPAGVPVRPNRAAADGWPVLTPVLRPAPAVSLPGDEIPAAVVIAIFAARGYTGAQIAAFFAA
ncbi:MAG: helix-turn-helix domain-containing protein [Dehalococcoidia bacterium]